MRQIKQFSDMRHDNQCAYCGKFPDTVDHVPSKILLDRPYPDNLQGVPCCKNCNESFSLDEEYFACLIECVISGTADPDEISRLQIAKILKRKPKLRARFQNSTFYDLDQTLFNIEGERVNNVLRKLSYGHVKYQIAETQFKEPIHFWYKPLQQLSEDERNDFFEPKKLDILPEIGSRSFQSVSFDVNGNGVSNWIIVQENIYAYSVITDLNFITVRILIWNYLVCETVWQN